MLDTFTMLVAVDAEFHVNYDLPQFLNWVIYIFECLLKFLHVGVRRKVRKKGRKNMDKHDNIRKEKPAGNLYLGEFQ